MSKQTGDHAASARVTEDGYVTRLINFIDAKYAPRLEAVYAQQVLDRRGNVGIK